MSLYEYAFLYFFNSGLSPEKAEEKAYWFEREFYNDLDDDLRGNTKDECQAMQTHLLETCPLL